MNIIIISLMLDLSVRSEAKHGNAGSQDGANHSNGGRTCFGRNVGAVGIAVAQETNLLRLPSVVCAEAVALLQHLVVDGSESRLREVGRGGA